MAVDPRDSSEEWVSIGQFPSLPRADLYRSLLESNGIQVFLLGENTASVAPHYALFAGIMEFQVRRCDAERAIQILQNAEQPAGAWEDADEACPGVDEEIEEAPEDTAGVTRCPNCGSTDIAKARTGLLLKIICVLLFCVPMLFSRPTWYCSSCNWQWNDSDG